MASPDGAAPPSAVPSGVLPDVVYRVKVGPKESLRYSLRSLANIPHGRVWIVGAKPEWVRGVEHVETVQRGNKWENSNLNLRAALTADTPEWFLLFDDDFYVVRSTMTAAVYHRGTVDEMIAEYKRRLTNDSAYMRRVREARDVLQGWGFEAPLSYEVHVPLPVHKPTMAGVMNRLADTPLKNKGAQYRTFYGNLAKIEGRKITDPKLYHPKQVAVITPEPADVEYIGAEDGLLKLDTPFVSSSNQTFLAAVGDYLRRTFPEKCEYEK